MTGADGSLGGETAWLEGRVGLATIWVGAEQLVLVAGGTAVAWKSMPGMDSTM